MGRKGRRWNGYAMNYDSHNFGNKVFFLSCGQVYSDIFEFAMGISHLPTLTASQRLKNGKLTQVY